MMFLDRKLLLCIKMQQLLCNNKKCYVITRAIKGNMHCQNERIPNFDKNWRISRWWSHWSVIEYFEHHPYLLTYIIESYLKFYFRSQSHQ